MNGIEAWVDVAIYVDDLDAAESYYRGVLGLEVIGKEANRHVSFRVRDGVPLTFDPDATLRGDMLPTHGAGGRATSPSACGPSGGGDSENRGSLSRGGRSLHFPATPGVWGLPGGW